LTRRHHSFTRSLAVLGFALSTLTVAACVRDDQARSEAESRLVVSDRTFDGLKNPGRLDDAIAHFGMPDELAGGSSSVDCHAKWRQPGVEALFQLWGAGSDTPPCKRTEPFLNSYARLTNRWKTDRGLAIGDPEARVRELYPDARRDTCGGPDGRGRPAWLLKQVADELGGPGSYLCTLGVETTDGKVVAFLLSSTAASE
jgi:hypothetical protein